MRTVLLILSLGACIEATGQTVLAPSNKLVTPTEDYHRYVLSLRPIKPAASGVLEETSKKYEGLTYTLEGDVHFLRVPREYEAYFIAFAGEGDSQFVTLDCRGLPHEQPPVPLTFFYMNEEKSRLWGRSCQSELSFENGALVGMRFKKPNDEAGNPITKAGFFVKMWKFATPPVLTPAGGAATPVAMTPPGTYLETILKVEDQNPLRAPTLKEELIVIEGMKIKVEAPAKFMALPEELKGFWIAPVSGGKSGAVLVDSERWRVGFLPFENGKTKGNAVQPLKGEPIEVNGTTVGWRFAKPAPIAGWLISLGLLPEAVEQPAAGSGQIP